VAFSAMRERFAARERGAARLRKAVRAACKSSDRSNRSSRRRLAPEFCVAPALLNARYRQRRAVPRLRQRR